MGAGAIVQRNESFSQVRNERIGCAGEDSVNGLVEAAIRSDAGLNESQDI